MNWIDVGLLLILLLAIWGGWRRGFILGTLDLVNWLGSVVLTFIFYPYTSDLLKYIFPALDVWLLPFGFLITLLSLRFLIGIITRKIALTASNRAHHNTVNRFLGILPGFVTGFVYATLIAALLLALPLWDNVTSTVRNSRIASQLSAQVEWVDQKLSPVFDKAVEQTINKLTIHPESNELVRLPFKETDVKTRPDLEEKMLELVNKERANEGLSPLKPDPELTEVARAHSRDMFARGYFAHVSPDGKTPFDRMRDSKVQFRTAGENLALAHSLQIAHKGLMNSPGHRANILSPSFGRLGIGIVDGGFHGLMVSQEFRN